MLTYFSDVLNFLQIVGQDSSSLLALPLSTLSLVFTLLSKEPQEQLEDKVKQGCIYHHCHSFPPSAPPIKPEELCSELSFLMYWASLKIFHSFNNCLLKTNDLRGIMLRHCHTLVNKKVKVPYIYVLVGELTVHK